MAFFRKDYISICIQEIESIRAKNSKSVIKCDFKLFDILVVPWMYLFRSELVCCKVQMKPFCKIIIKLCLLIN